MQGLAGVLLEVHTLDLDAVGLDSAVVVGDLDLEVTVDAQRFVVLRDLVVLRHVRIEVVLAREATPRRDAAVEREADPDRALDPLLVGDRKASRQTEADRADLRVGVRAELRRAPTEQLGRRTQLAVGPKTS